MDVETNQAEATDAGVLAVDDTAARAIQALFKRQGREGCGFRIAVKGGGCSGLQYEFSVAETPRPDDTVIEKDGVTVVVDPKSAVFVAGSVLSYERSLMKEGFVVRNPGAGQSCSCGESFSA